MMSTEYLLPGYWNSDTCVATSAMNLPRLFTHWIPRLQTLNEKSLLQLRQQPTHSRLKFIDDYLEDARKGEDKEYSFTSPWIPESTHNRDNSTILVLAENITTCVASPSSTVPSSPRSHLPSLVTTTHLLPFSQSSDLDSPTTSLSSASSLFSEVMIEDSCPPESLPQKISTSQDDAGAQNLGDLLSVSITDS